MNQSIFTSFPRTRTSTANPREYETPSQAHAARRPSSAPWSTSSDIALLAILEAPLHDGETAAVGFARKEAELRHAMATLSVLESRALQSRLSYPKAGDQLATAFMRLTGDRRARLLNFLAEARRREALGRR